MRDIIGPIAERIGRGWHGLRAWRPFATAGGAEASPPAGELGADLSRRALGKRDALVKRRPATLEQRYALLESAEVADEAFRRLQRAVWAAIDQRQSTLGASTVFREAGRLAPGRLYFFVKSASERGWLVERTGIGWAVTGADKIVAQDLFLRDQESADYATLFGARDRVLLPRVKARAAGDQLLAFAVYEQRLLTQLGLG